MGVEEEGEGGETFGTFNKGDSDHGYGRYEAAMVALSACMDSPGKWVQVQVWLRPGRLLGMHAVRRYVSLLLLT